MLKQSLLKQLIGSNSKKKRPLRREMLSKELLALRATSLAKEHISPSDSERGYKLKNRFKENYQVLNSVYFSLSDISQHNGFLAAGADWLLDNYHVIDEQVREIRRDLPSGYYKALPKISVGEWKGFPRVYCIACDYLEHTDSLVQLDTLNEYIGSFQKTAPLKLCELWAIPIMLRLAIVENIRQLSESILEISLHRQESEDLFHQIVGTEDISAIQILNNLLEELSSSPKKIKRSAPFLARKLRSLGSKSSLGIQWLEEQLKILEIDLNEVEKKQQQTQAADQISVGNGIISLKSIGRLNWRDWVEDVSIVTNILRTDPSNIFSLSDFFTRDHIRHRVEILSQRTKKSEEDVARTAIHLSQQGNKNKDPNNNLLSQVGYYLIDDGLLLLENSLETIPPLSIKLIRLVKRNITCCYLSAIGFLTLFFTTIAYRIISPIPQSSFYIRALIFILLVIPASQLASEFIQWLCSRIIKPKPLPKLELENNIPECNKTAVVIQSIIMSRDHLKKTIEDLEIRAIGNLDPNIQFGILADLADSETEHQSGDRGLITLGCDLIRQLNEEYKEQGGKFFLLFRKRQFNSSQNLFMGWERKRGKISEFNRFLQGDDTTSFSVIEADIESLRGTNFVITLDNDTHLPPGSAKKLVGCAAHPLNIPIIDSETGSVKRGYGILQPRVGITLESASSSVFASLFSGQSGLDPYTQAISDIYQDLFRSASYIGKGIYHVDVFEKALENQIPENTVLSHDLLESGYTRCGLASDIEVFDDFPQRYHSHSKRQHRWIRGDWQLLPWILSNGTSSTGRRKLSSLVKWKLIDNLRRSILAPCVTLLFLMSILGGAKISNWLLASFFLLAFRVYSLTYSTLFSIPFGYSLSTFFGHQLSEFKRNLACWSIEIITLPHQALLSIDAIIRTLYRMTISKKNLLEWQTALSTEQKLTNSLSSFVRIIAPSSLILIASTALCLFFTKLRLEPDIAFVLLAWISSPYITWKISNSRPTETYSLNQSEVSYLQGVAYDTWRYFRSFLVEKYNFLIPDNLQQIPESVVAERTSPTNISLSMLATLSAYDLGFIPSPLALEKITKVISTLEKLEKHNGHLLNWYSITDLRPLFPRYVSSVDSGNFVGHLMAIREGVRLLPFSDFLSKRSLEFLKDRGIIAAYQNTFEQWTFFTKILPTILLRESDSDTKRELIADLDHLTPFIDWLKHTEIFESLSTKGLLPKKLERFDSILDDRHLTPSLNAKMVNRLLNSRSKIDLSKLSEDEVTKINLLFESLEKAQLKTKEFSDTINHTILKIDKLINDTKFQFLFDKSKKLLSIGYNVDSAVLDSASYDLLASEARLASFVAIAKGDLPQTHWFFLGRALTDTSGGKALISWSGTMFEYLMPTIVMRDYQSTLLSQTYRTVIRAQEDYAKRRNVPWGISESAYGTVDFENTYQYRAFGVPGLGLKRGLIDDLVISPYSTALSLPIYPEDSIRNLKVLEASNARGEFGFFEAIDYTEERLVADEKFHIIKSFFAHHQGMSLVAINNTINKSVIINRFHNDHRVQSCELLLQERFPVRIPLLQPHQAEQLMMDEGHEENKEDTREHFYSPEYNFPRTHLLSNGEYSVLIDHCGSGVSSYKNNFHINRFRDDGVNNSYGQYIFLRDEESGEFWSTTYQPTRIKPEQFEVIFSPHKTEHHLRALGIYSMLETIVSPEDNVEIRKLSITNHSKTKKKLSATSFFEVALADFRADLAHPAFSKLFVSSTWDDELGYLIFNRKPRSKNDSSPILFHLITSEIVWERPQFCTDRASFIGRGRSLRNPQGLACLKELDSSTGFVLDPSASIRHVLELDPAESSIAYFITGVANSVEEAELLAKKYREIYNLRRAFELAWSYASVELKNQHFSKGSAKDFQRLANAIVYNIPELRKPQSATIEKLSQNALWRLGISGDEPIVLLNLNESPQLSLFNELVLAHEYLRSRGITFDLVILNEKTGGYLQELQDELESFLRASLSAHLLNQRGGIFIRNALHISEAERNLLETSARVVLSGERGPLSSQLRFETTKGHIRTAPEGITTEVNKKGAFPLSISQSPEYPIGKFNPDSHAYEFEINPNLLPPQPWSNVVANKECGFLVTESGGGYTWFGNSRENRLTPWSNDPIIDPCYEAIYLRDCSSSDYWSPTLKPIPDHGSVKVSHGLGYSSFYREHGSITTNLTQFVGPIDTVKYWHLQVQNTSNTTKTIEIIFYLEWILGVTKSESFRTVIGNVEKQSGFLYAQNPWSIEFGKKISFVGATIPLQDYTTDRLSFVGPSGSMARPAFLQSLIADHGVKKQGSPIGSTLSRKVGSGFDSAAILKYEIELAPNGKYEIGFYASQANSIDEAIQNSKRYSSIQNQVNELEASKKYWIENTAPIKVSTPSKDFDNILNGWLLYQTLSCRINARTGFFQSSGALGFRDQLQDSLAFLDNNPSLTRSQIVLHASRQFEEGDVQHWWHPPSGRGIRSRISDNLLWMPFAVLEYIDSVGDSSILEEEIGFLKGPLLELDQHDLYFTPEISSLKTTLYDHCCRALDRSLAIGSHGLPLMGSGDWNDGMNEVGSHGKGESVWLAWFLAGILERFSHISESRNDTNRKLTYLAHSSNLTHAIEENAWDGNWYRRAYFDDGTPLGSIQRDECQIDSLAQSWASITNLGDSSKRQAALMEAYNRLFDKEHQLVRLLWPPLQHSIPSAGYIQSYPPGIRENGGQYTHGSTWLIAALAVDGFKDEAFELFNAMNPSTHTDSQAKISIYKTEPYVTCGDVYSHSQHAGRGGWSWYTGSSGWLYQVGMHYILGIQAKAQGLSITPRVPKAWNEFSAVGTLRNKPFKISAVRSDSEKGLQFNSKNYLDVIPWDDLKEVENNIILKF